MYVCDRWSTLLYHASTGSSLKGSQLQSLLGHAHAPIVVFPEGSTSNGRALLSFISDLTYLPRNQRLHLLSFKYLVSDGGFTATLPLGGKLAMFHFFVSLCRQVSILLINRQPFVVVQYLACQMDQFCFTLCGR